MFPPRHKLTITFLLLLLVLPTLGISKPSWGIAHHWARPSIQPLQIEGRTFCTAFSINEQEGNWATARHCADYAAELGHSVTILNQPAYVVFVDQFYDVAVYQAPKAKMPALKLGKAPTVGDPISIMGFPYGLPELVTVWGRVAARHVPITGYNISDILDITVAGGNSGSPVLSEKGRVIGIVWGAFIRSPHTLSVPFESVERALKGYWG